MNSSSNYSAKSPRKEIRGARPTPLQVRKDSHLIRKPPLQPRQQHPPPLIIYTLSPKLYKVEPNEFMQVVQRLTGQSSSAVFDTSSTAAISPAARFAVTEYLDRPPKGKTICRAMSEADVGAGIDEITGMFPGILSPPPVSLPPIPQDYFAPSSQISPVDHGKHYMDKHHITSEPTHSNNSFSPKIMAYSPNSQDYFINFYDI